MKEHQLGDGPISSEYLEKMNQLARLVDKYFNGDTKGVNRETGFVLLVYKYGVPKEGDCCNFISNGADRKDLIVLFKEMIARFEGQPEINNKTVQ